MALCMAALGAAGTRAFAQRCDDEHYRWAAKTTVALRESALHRTTVSSMLDWPPRDLFRPAIGHPDCTVREGRELEVFEVTGWVRAWKVETGAHGDLDWHIELTASDTSAPTRCVVAEIPDPRYGIVFDSARAALITQLRESKPETHVTPPIRITVIGPAFFDGEHRGSRMSGSPPSGHGNCNASASALWEIHPVYRVIAPSAREDPSPTVPHRLP